MGTDRLHVPKPEHESLRPSRMAKRLKVLFPQSLFFFFSKYSTHTQVHNQQSNNWGLIPSHPCGKEDALPLIYQWMPIYTNFRTSKL